MHKRLLAVSSAVGVVVTIIGAPAAMASSTHPRPNVCVSSAFKTYTVKSRAADVLVQTIPTVSLDNSKGKTIATLTTGLTITGSVSIAASITAGASVGVDFAVVKAGVQASGTTTATVTLSGSYVTSASMQVRPGMTGDIKGGIFRTVTTGEYDVGDTTCHVTTSTVYAHTPYKWGYITSGG